VAAIYPKDGFMEKVTQTIVVGTTLGFITRLLLLRLDYRQYPGYPHGYIIHLALGFIASALGAVAIASLTKPDFAAVTFLALAAQQFRDIRNMERETLTNIESAALIPRGLDYIEGIAKVFEARNYLVMATSFIVSLVFYNLTLFWAILVGLILIIISRFYMRGKVIEDIADVVPARLSFKNSLLVIDDNVVMNVGLKEMREKILRDGLAVKIIPKNANGRATLHDMGQRQAIVHDTSVILGTKKEVDSLEFTSMARKNVDTGEIVFYMVPVEKNTDALIKAIKRVPVLESAVRKPLSTEAGKEFKR
jgi:uncharacterized protein